MNRFDLVVYGATGFTGRYAVEYLRSNAPSGLKWAVAGRSPEKLEALGVADRLVADSSEPSSVTAMAARARVVLSFAGPYCVYGDVVVDACVEEGAHYVDITGETPWVRGLIDRHHGAARDKGLRIVPFCGFDSVPSDLGAWWMVQQVRERLGQGTRRVQSFFRSKGGFNGGTLATGREVNLRYPLRQLADPFLLDGGETTRELWSAHADPRRPLREPHTGSWAAPFFMGPINTRVVRRSAALRREAGEPYGQDFSYQEYLWMKSRSQAWAATALTGAAGGLLGSRFGRWLLEQFGPKPGEGPSAEAVAEGFTKVLYVAESEGGEVLLGELRSEGDPGNAFTTRSACESALALATEGDALPDAAGLLTPSVALGGVLLRRLEASGKDRFTLREG